MIRTVTTSSDLFARAQKILVGGVDSPVRAFRAVGGEPLIIDRARGSRIVDVDGREYIDYVCSWGALILGHADPDVVAAIADQATRGTSYGMTSPLEIELGERIAAALPSIERIRFVSSGTEAAMSAVRLARGFHEARPDPQIRGRLSRPRGWIPVGGGLGPRHPWHSSQPGRAGELAALTLNAPYNDAAAVEQIFAQHSHKIAAIIVEPVAANMGVVPPAPGFLESLRRITERDGALLIFDEVITGFRLAYGGAQTAFGIRPDLTVLGKIIGGGLPVAAYGGRREIMDMIAPLGPVYQAGTLSGNPLAMRAGLASLGKLNGPGFYDGLARKAGRLAVGLREALADSDVPGHVQRSRITTHPFLRRRFGPQLRRSKSRIVPVSPRSSGRCFPAACFYRHRSSRPCLSRRPMLMKTLIVLSPPPDASLKAIVNPPIVT